VRPDGVVTCAAPLMSTAMARPPAPALRSPPIVPHSTDRRVPSSIPEPGDGPRTGIRGPLYRGPEARQGLGAPGTGRSAAAAERGAGYAAERPASGPVGTRRFLGAPQGAGTPRGAQQGPTGCAARTPPSPSR